MGTKSKDSADFKLMIIHETETSGITRTSRKYSLSDHTIRHGLRGRTQLSQWIIGSNESILEDYRSGKRDSEMKGRKTPTVRPSFGNY